MYDQTFTFDASWSPFDPQNLSSVELDGLTSKKHCVLSKSVSVFILRLDFKIDPVHLQWTVLSCYINIIIMSSSSFLEIRGGAENHKDRKEGGEVWQL